MEGLLKQMFDNLFKLHGSFKMFKSLLLNEDGDGASRTSTGKEFQRSGARFESIGQVKVVEARKRVRNEN